MNLLIQFDSNYADEFDVEGFLVMTKEEWETHKAAIQKRFDALPPKDPSKYYGEELEAYFGTNESLSWGSMDAYLHDFKVTEISDEEHAVLKKFFGERIRNGTVVMLDEGDY